MQSHPRALLHHKRCTFKEENLGKSELRTTIRQVESTATESRSIEIEIDAIGSVGFHFADQAGELRVAIFFGKQGTRNTKWITGSSGTWVGRR